MIGTQNKFIAALHQTVTVLVGKWSPPSLCIFLNEEGIFKVFSMVQFWLAISHTFCTAENTCELFHTVFTATQNVQCQNMSSSRGVNAQTWWYQLSQRVSKTWGRVASSEDRQVGRKFLSKWALVRIFLLKAEAKIPYVIRTLKREHWWA